MNIAIDLLLRTCFFHERQCFYYLLLQHFKHFVVMNHEHVFVVSCSILFVLPLFVVL